MPTDKPDWYDGDWKDLAAKNAVNMLQPGIDKMTPYIKNGKLDKGQMVKDLAVDAASQIPLMAIPEAGMGRAALRAGTSLASGLGLDQLLNPSKTLGDSTMDAGTNTALSMLIPGLLENKIVHNPSPVTGTGVSAPVLKLLSTINPANWSVTPKMMTRPGASQAVPANLGNTILDLLTSKNSPLPRSVKLGAAGLGPNTINQMIKNALGFGVNAGLDTTINAPTQ